MFKDKTSKKKINVNETKEITTLDEMHVNIIKDFKHKQKEKIEYTEHIENITKIQDIIKNKIKEYHESNNYDSNEYNLLWNSNIKIQEDIIETKNKIKNMEYFDEIEYYKQTNNILFNYYDTIERQNNFKGNIEFNNILNTKNNTEKSILVDEYLSIVNKTHIKKTKTENKEICKKCKIPLICYQHDAIIICNNCGYQELLLVEQNKPILKQTTKENSHFSYKRINHFREWCNQVQGKESTDIPDEIFEKILNEIKKEKIEDIKQITYTKMREILKHLRINKYYEHINYIINRINGIPTPQFSPELEDKLCSMFKDIQGPFLKYCPKERKNFLSYSYVLYKFFQLLDLEEYLKYFPLLKSREKLYIQDQIWKKICIDLNYKIIPSL